MRPTLSQRVVVKLVKNPIVRFHANLKQESFAPEDVLILTGDPRSGTTWMSEVIAAEKGVTIITEPLSLRRKHIAELGFTWRMFLPLGQQEDQAKRYFDQLFTGQVINYFDRHRASLKEIWQTKTWLIKFVRANRLLPWLVNQYHFTYQPLHIIRHPCGVVYSQLKHHAFDPLSNIGEQDRVWIEHYRPDLKPLLNKIETEVQIRALTWALDNYIPLTYWAANKWMVISYEQMVLDSQNMLQKIYQAWHKELPATVLARVPHKSRSTYEWAQFDDSGRKQLGSWKEQLTHTQISEILEVVHAVGLPEFTDEIEPDYDLLYRRHE